MNHEDRLRAMLQRVGEVLPEGPRLDRETTVRKAKRDHVVRMAAAGAVTAAVLALGAISAGTLFDDDGLRPLPIPPAGTPTTEPSVGPTPTESASPEVTCSATGMSAEPSQQDLPKAVETLRSRIIDAAVGCDYEELARIGLEGDFTHSGGSSEDPARYWKKIEDDPKSEEDPMAALVATLDLPYCIEEATSAGVTLYAWPAVQCSTSTDNDYDGLAASGLYTEEEIRGFKQAGNFLGWRVGITQDGDWLYFRAGD